MIQAHAFFKIIPQLLTGKIAFIEGFANNNRIHSVRCELIKLFHVVRVSDTTGSSNFHASFFGKIFGC